MINWPSLSFEDKKLALARPLLSDSKTCRQQVQSIIEDVKMRGDAAVLEYTQRFDCTSITTLRLSEQDIQRLATSVKSNVKQAIEQAFDNIKAFHVAQEPEPIIVETVNGVVCEQHHAALEAVGLYIPGGTAPLPSTVLMLGIPALVAQCERRILCTPPNQQGLIAPEIAYAAQLCDIDEIWLCGGAQAIAAMAFGTESIGKVDKIYGPGNRYVTEAKQQVSQTHEGAAIDMPAGPSEVLVLADKNADAKFVASDLLSQAEHGVDSQAIMVCDCEYTIEQTKAQVEQQIETLERSEITRAAMQNARYIKTDSVSQSIEVSNQYAPEHLIVQLSDAVERLNEIKHAGSIFVGAWSPESAGDYASGTNHVLPTYGYARNYSSLGLTDFMRRYTVQTLSQTGLRYLAPSIIDLADAEGLTAHANAVKIRLNTLDDKDQWHD